MYRLRNKSYDDRLRILGFTTLVTRRLRGDLLETYKILHSEEGIGNIVSFAKLCRMVTNCDDMAKSCIGLVQ